jgi:glycosyltransferase involved in cell wall biosynthesis
MKCLWISRHIPYPMTEGLKVYSAKLAESLATAGAFVRVLGFGDVAATPQGRARMEWRAVAGERRNSFAGLLSRMPLTAAVDSVPAFRQLLDEQLREPWDAIVFDSYGSGWALDRCRHYCSNELGARTVLVHVSHNHEEALWHSMARRATAGIARRAALWQNYYKVRELERRLVRGVDLVTAITEEDELALRAQRADNRTMTLTPGYDGAVAPERIIDAAVPRQAVIVGSFHWVVKRENLERFIEHADPLFAARGIQLVVAGDVPADLQATLVSRCRATHFQGFVSNLAPLLAQARIAVVPELIGGGFKLKFLDYIFSRVPVATVGAAAAGLPVRVRAEMITSDDFAGLASAIAENIDQLDVLNHLQQAAFGHARTLYRWEDRGRQLLERVADVQSTRAALHAESRNSGRIAEYLSSRST